MPDTLWTTDYLGLPVAQMRAEGRYLNDEALAQISPGPDGVFGSAIRFPFGA